MVKLADEDETGTLTESAINLALKSAVLLRVLDVILGAGGLGHKPNVNKVLGGAGRANA